MRAAYCTNQKTDKKKTTLIYSDNFFDSFYMKIAIFLGNLFIVTLYIGLRVELYVELRVTKI